MIRWIPILPTLIVLAAVAVMMRLGFWQLDRLAQKEALLARYAAAQILPEEIRWPVNPKFGWQDYHADVFYRRSRFTCEKVLEQSARAGLNLKGDAGWAHIAKCELPEGGKAELVLGWSQDPVSPTWQGGDAVGRINSGGRFGIRLVADPPLAGLQANAKPDPSNIPNNHLAYAVQWFLFALTALVIYGLALRKRLAQSSPERGGGSPQD